MAIQLIDQETQIRRTFPVSDYGDAVAPSEANYETNPVSLMDDLNNIRSQLHNFLNGQNSNWWADLNTPSALETGTQRGINDLNTDLHVVEKKRVLRDVYRIGGVTVGGSDDFVVLALGELPSNTTAAIGAVTTLGTVGAYAATFGAASLDEVAGGIALNPLNLCNIVDSVTRDPILSDGRKVYGLFQTESNTDGSTMTGTTPNRAQISFVRQNAAGTDLELCPAADIQGKTIAYSTRERVRLEDLNEVDFLNGAVVDIGAGSASITRQVGYTNQGATVVDIVANATLDVGTGLTWALRDAGDEVLFSAHDGDAGSDGVVTIGAGADTFDVNAGVNDFLNGASFDTGAAGTTIDIGVTAANQITSGGALAVQAAGDLKLVSTGGNLRLTDQYEPVGWSEDGIQLSDAAQTWTDFEAAFGEVGLMDAILQAYNKTGRRKVSAIVNTSVAADTDVSLTDGNIDTELGDLSAGTFTTDYDIYLNGVLQVNGANAAADKDVYPGTSLVAGQLKFEKKLKSGNVITVIDWVG